MSALVDVLMTHYGAPAMTADARVAASVPPPSVDAAAAAVLTACTDGADAAMSVFVHGCGGTLAALDLIERIHAAQCQQAFGVSLLMDEAVERFDQGWYRCMGPDDQTTDGTSPDAVKRHASFQRALKGWLRRRAAFPERTAQDWHEWITVSGTAWVVTASDPLWPAQLEDLRLHASWAPPLCLWGRGDVRALTACPAPLAIIGSRAVSDYGAHVAQTLAGQAVRAGHAVVSGGAMGIDACAHWGAVDALAAACDGQASLLDSASMPCGPTIAVFAGGLNHIGPSTNARLFEHIQTWHGALISEMPPDCAPVARRFLMRNRIIAALSSVICVAQARVRSGALNTAHWAQELNRELYATPGLITRADHTGCHTLIDEQAARILQSCEHIDDICHERHAPHWPSVAEPTADTTADTMQPADLSDNERIVLDAVRQCHRQRVVATASAIGQYCEASVAMPVVFAALGALEMRGLIANNNGAFAIL
ncbi:DNA-processing protein DprA [Bifidobacterium gallicum]|uniref:DNA protecting protein DprA n=1 Tax=Bifidobacterium gallicum DSM 20093 = LMG 11596 TaxID=561180 RepID=D1NRZ7_9BIFI|nr:DNA-processing protein DprA [Bifidobacterium gallicum]EFA23449.1 putative DNA protecting protein DprA [Bifidobacterium gallicum DSM 20093 = LMG 11596]KFI57260.1 DNA protecting protein DprA [Bifidobacterium gallicum DSM 20093 = LMG 11596]